MLLRSVAGDAAGAVETDAALKSKLEADSKAEGCKAGPAVLMTSSTEAKKDEGALLLYCMKYKACFSALQLRFLRSVCLGPRLPLGQA